MKLFLLFIPFVFSVFLTTAQNNQTSALPEGRYEAIVKQNQSRWNMGDIILLDGSHYKISTSDETGEYRFSETAQRIFFTSGPLKSVFARTALNANKPVIIIPVAENEQQGLNLVSNDVWAYLKN
jgi:hypothetical protein